MDDRLYNTIFAEAAGGSPEEIAAVTSVFLNRADKEGLEKALGGSSAYRKQSNQYKKAATGSLSPYEAKVFSQIKSIVDDISNNPEKRQPYTFFENVKAFGDPILAGKWPKEMSSWEFKDIGRQRFYNEPKDIKVVSKELKRQLSAGRR